MYISIGDLTKSLLQTTKELMRRTFAGRRQSIQCGEVQTLDSILGMYPPLAYPVEVYI
jgi:hypothetical protein